MLSATTGTPSVPLHLTRRHLGSRYAATIGAACLLFLFLIAPSRSAWSNAKAQLRDLRPAAREATGAAPSGDTREADRRSSPAEIPPVNGSELEVLLRRFVDEFVEITPGRGGFPDSFVMGRDDGPASERPAHRVRMRQAFAIAKYETPQNLYQAVMGHNPSRWKGPRNAAEMMTWHEALQFCERATTLLRQRRLIGPDEFIRLPSEAEWEYCCRAGTRTRYSFGDDAQAPGDVAPKASILDRYAWHTGNAAGNDPPVGALKPNPWGLYDVHGYLWEMTEDDWFDDYRSGPADARPRTASPGDRASPSATDGAAGRSSAAPVPRITIRGGSWRDPYPLLTSTARRPFPVNARSDAVGFRCVRSKRPPRRVPGR